jgi:2'-5' RNA ligase
MEKLIALDVAILPPAEVSKRAMALSAALSAEEERHEGVPVDREERREGVPADRESQGLRLDHEHLPHITLTQQFIREEEIDVALSHIDGVLRDVSPLRIIATGGGKGGHAIWISIERTPELDSLHEQLMEALRGVERSGGTPAAFFGGDGRIGDVLWVAGYRLKSSFGDFLPHITIGHGAEPPAIEPFAFDATTVAACHLGRFCTCRRVLRNWSLSR